MDRRSGLKSPQRQCNLIYYPLYWIRSLTIMQEARVRISTEADEFHVLNDALHTWDDMCIQVVEV